MKKSVGFLIASVVLVLAVCALATDKTFTSSGSIVDGDIYNFVQVQNNGTIVNMSGGQINESLFIRDSSTFNMSDGSISGGITISPSSILNVSNGTINGGWNVESNAIVNISGGNITAGLLKTYPGYPSIPESIVNINGGILNFDMFGIGGTLNIYRGLLNVNKFSYWGTSSEYINIYGSEFNYNPITQILTGHLLDNNLFTIGGVDSIEYTKFNLIPEPISIMFFSFGLAFLRKQK